MSAIASTGSQQFMSPLSRLTSELASEVSAGTVSASDQDALSSALQDIDSAMQASKPADGSRPSPDEMKAKIDGLIDKEVSDGKLTSDQAAELKNVFSNTFKGGPQGAGGPPPGGGAGGAGGAAGSAGSSSTDPADTNGDGTVSAAEQAAYDAKNVTSSSNSDTDKMVQDFLKLVQNSNSNSSTYGSDGDSLMSKLQSLLVDYKA